VQPTVRWLLLLALLLQIYIAYVAQIVTVRPTSGGDVMRIYTRATRSEGDLCVVKIKSVLQKISVRRYIQATQSEGHMLYI
jgi:hypothetical protein